jgi:hypothetical protein
LILRSHADKEEARFDDAERQGKVHMFDLWRFGLDVQQVMTTRVLRMMAGELSEPEARRMVTEKQTAYTTAQMAGAYALLTGGPVEASHEMIEVYRRAVRDNCDRLSAE